MRITGTLTADLTITGSLVSSPTIGGTLTVPSVAGVDRYEGSYDFTPSEEEQTIAIDHKMATQDITIQPIPTNYGLITWNGTTLTVS